MKTKFHQLKTEKPYFDEVVSGNKKFEVRKNDRDFKVGDVLVLEEIETYPKGRYRYTGEEYSVKVLYILDDERFVQPGYVVMSIEPVVVFTQSEDDVNNRWNRMMEMENDNDSTEGGE